MELIETIGWLGSALLAFCGLPETISCFITKKCTVPWALLVPWYLGEILAFIYTLKVFGINPLLYNYMANILFISVMIYYRLKTSKELK